MEGKAKASLGKKVADLAGFPEDVIVEANALLGKLQSKGANQEDIHLKEEDFEKEKLLRVKSELENIDLNSITPLEALNILQKLKGDK